MPVPSPISWISEVGGKSGQDLPSRRLEMLNGHQRLRSYILFCLNEANFEGGNIQQKSAIRQHLDDVAELVDKKKMFSQLRKLYKQQKKRKEKMKSIIQPSQKENLQNCIRVWFASKESEALEIEALEIYNTFYYKIEHRHKSTLQQFAVTELRSFHQNPCEKAADESAIMCLVLIGGSNTLWDFLHLKNNLQYSTFLTCTNKILGLKRRTKR